MFWRFSTFLAVLVVAAAALAGGKVRTWTSTDGRTMQAEFVRELDGDVTFLKDGKLVVIKLEKLSEKDQQVVKDLAAGKGLEEDPFTTPNPSPAAASSQEKPAEAPSEKSTGKSREKPEKKKPITIQSRTWTDRFGNKSSGKYVRVDGNDVVITRGAKVVTVVFSNLSDADQEYVRNILISQGKEDAIPSATATEGPVGAGGAGGNFPGGNAGFPPAGGGMSGPGMMPRGGMPGGGGGMPGGPGRGPGAGMGGMTPGINPPPSTTGSGMEANPGPAALGPMGMGMGGMGMGPAGTGFPGGMSPPGAMAGGAGMGGAGGMPAPAMGPGMMGGPGGMSPPPGMMGQGMGPGMSPGMGGMGPGMGSRMPGMEPTSIPQSPSFPGVQIEEYFECSKCKAKLTKLEASGSTCPRCSAIWGFKQDEFGNKTMTSAGRTQMSSVGVVIVIFVLLGLVVFVALFIGIIVAIVKAASAPARPPQPMPQQRYY